MPSLHDIYGARLLLKRGLVSLEELWRALRESNAALSAGTVKSLVAVLCSRGLLDEDRARKMRLATSRHQTLVREKLLARLVIERDLVTRSQLLELVERQRQGDFRDGLGPMLRADGYIDARQLAELQAAQASAYGAAVAESEARFLAQVRALSDRFDSAQGERVCLMIGISPARASERDPLTNGSARFTLSRSESQLDFSAFDRPAQDSGGLSLATLGCGATSPIDCPIYGYQILEELGQGAMGVVYKARHLFSDRVMALKVLPIELATSGPYLERFKREATACLKLQHDNIVRAFDFGGSEDFYYLALEFIEGMTLDSRLEGGLMPPHEALCVARDIARGLDFAAAQGVLHRDVKPENIMLAPGQVAKLCDFGIVKLMDFEGASANVTQAGTTVGTPYYISPEQAKGDVELDVRSDIYSLGITLYQMLTGEVPFTGKSQGAILVRHLLEEVPDPRTKRAALHPEVAALVKRMTAKKREQRFESAGELARSIDALITYFGPH